MNTKMQSILHFSSPYFGSFATMHDFIRYETIWLFLLPSTYLTESGKPSPKWPKSEKPSPKWPDTKNPSPRSTILLAVLSKCLEILLSSNKTYLAGIAYGNITVIGLDILLSLVTLDRLS